MKHVDFRPKHPLYTPMRVAHAVAIATIAILLVGCGAKIGDECITSADCALGQVCDSSQPGGYCTVLNCSPGGCPEDSLCVEFDNDESYCMVACDVNSDCRANYVCVHDVGPHPFCNSAPAPLGVQ